MKNRTDTATNVMLGMAAGAAVSAAGMMLAGQNKRQVRRTARKLAHGAEQAVDKLDKMVTDFTAGKM